ncbi:hypothetical protein RCO48_02360 [Peribacillus frigoritolerans]|nr:hypothetical protein [Peribacillus frigoritolerans]
MVRLMTESLVRPLVITIGQKSTIAPNKSNMIRTSRISKVVKNKGAAQGMKDGYLESESNSFASPGSDAYKEGYATGYNKGYADGKKKNRSRKKLKLPKKDTH